MENSYFKELVEKKGITELFNIDPDRADLVGYPAIGRKFLLIKSHGPEETEENKTQSEGFTMNKTLLSLTTKVRKSGFSSEAIDAFAKLEKSVTDGNASAGAVTSLLKELEVAFKDESNVTKSKFDAWLEKADNLIQEVTDVEEDDEEITKDEVPAPVVEPDVVEPDVVEPAVVEPAVVEPPVVEPVVEEDDEEVEDTEGEELVTKSLESQIKKQATELKEARKEFKKAQDEIKELRIEKQRKDLVVKSAEQLTYIGKSADEVGGLLMSLKTAGVPDDVFDTIFGLLKSSNDMIKQSGFFNEHGTSLDDEDDDDPDVSLMKSAKGLVKDGKFNTVEQAYVSLLRTDPSALQNN